MLKITALAENKENEKGHLPGEHGLSLFLEYGGMVLLLDAGTTGLFARNAQRLGIDLENVDAAVLSHAHYDHSGGFKTFFSENHKAKLYMQSTCHENCWRLLNRDQRPEALCGTSLDTMPQASAELLKYIGIPKGMLSEYRERICFVDGDVLLSEGVWLISHHTPDLWKNGRRAGMYRLENGRFVYDDFSHEQSLVLETKAGLVVFNSCCHGGPDTVIREILSCPAFAGRRVIALFGGFHLKDIPETAEGMEQVSALGKRLKKTGVDHFYTGHCTGTWAFEGLERILGKRLSYFKTGDSVLLDE